MPDPYIIPIDNGTGTENILDGTYNVTAVSLGYDNTSILPITVTVTEGVDTYDFTIAASGALTLHVQDSVSSAAIQGATFQRCDAGGVEYGAPVTSNASGDATFENLPYAAEGAPIIYYKQTTSDDNHGFDDTLQNITLTTETETIQVLNTPGASRTITLKDLNYDNMNILAATITLTEQP